MKTKGLVNVLRAGAEKNGSKILTGLGVAGVISTAYLSVRATPKAIRLIEQAEDHGIGIIPDENEPDWIQRPLTKLETMKGAWKPYIPAIISGITTIACIIGSETMNTRTKAALITQNAAIATAYKLSETALADYKASIIETVGEAKDAKIKENIAQKKIAENPISKSEVIVAGNGEVLFLEPVSMRYFKSDVETIRKVVNDINYRLTSGMEEYVSLSEFYDEIGLSHTTNSDDIGWNIGRDGQLRLDFAAGITEDNKPCLVLDYSVLPRYDYTKLM